MTPGRNAVRNVIAILASAALLTLAGAATAATDSYGPAYAEKQWIVSGSLGFGDAGYFGTDQSPLYAVTAEYGYDSHISIGGTIGHSGSSYHAIYGGTDYKWTYGYTIVAARGSYHFADQLTVPNLDLYAGATLGYNSVSVKAPNISGYSYKAGDSALRAGVYGGGRYWFNPKWGAFGEIGVGIGNLVLGVSTRF
jgi:hypothetical protein